MVAAITAAGHEPVVLARSTGADVLTGRGLDEAVAGAEVFDYPGRGHLFTDPSLPDEYDAAAAELLWERVLAFLRPR